MRLISVSPKFFGPFVAGEVLEVHPEVTVITGANDVGKSSLLRLIELSLRSESGTEEEFSLSREEFNWRTDAEFGGLFRFAIDGKTSYPGYQPLPAGTLEYQFKAAPNLTSEKGAKLYANAGSTRHNVSINSNLSPNLINLSKLKEVGDQTNLRTLTPSERGLLNTGSRGFSVDAHLGFKKERRTDKLDEISDELSARVAELFPSELARRIILAEGDEPHLVNLRLSDRRYWRNGILSRGAGVRKVLTILGALLALPKSESACIVLADEPENSLHPDAQRYLRHFFEDLGRSDKVQVIYATHSPTMINSSRPETVRVLKRRIVNDSIETKILNDAYVNNFDEVRISLGMTPSDSLLYADVVIVTEGPTETFCLHFLLDKLSKVSPENFAKYRDLKPYIIYVSSNGCGEVHRYCTLAEAQNARVVAFTDGDLDNTTWERISSGTWQHVSLDRAKREEFEEIVDIAVYIEALREVLGDASISEMDYSTWINGNPKYATLAFSKRIGKWLAGKEIYCVEKPVVMRKAIENASPNNIRLDRLIPLMAAIEKAFQPNNKSPMS